MKSLPHSAKSQVMQAAAQQPFKLSVYYTSHNRYLYGTSCHQIYTRKMRIRQLSHGNLWFFWRRVASGWRVCLKKSTGEKSAKPAQLQLGPQLESYDLPIPHLFCNGPNLTTTTFLSQRQSVMWWRWTSSMSIRCQMGLLARGVQCNCWTRHAYDEKH